MGDSTRHDSGPAPAAPGFRHWLTAERIRLYSLACLSVYLFLGVYLGLKLNHGVDPHGNPLGCDFITFWGASHLALGGHPLDAYDPHLLFAAEKQAIPWADFEAASPWQYPPTFYLVVLPLALLPYFPALAAFLAFSFVPYLCVVGRIVPRRAALLPLLAFPGVFVNAGGGQNGFLTAALVSAALLLLRTRPAWAGVLIGLLTIKPQLGLLLPLALVCGRHWRAFAFACLSAAAFLGISVAALGTDTLSAFLGRLPVVAGWLAQGLLPLKKMPTFFSLLRTAGASVQAAYAAQAIVAAAATAGVAWIWLRCRDAELRAAALVAGTLLVSPYLYDYDLVWLAPAMAWFAAYALRRGWRRGEREVLAAVWFLPALMILSYATLRVQLAAPVLLLFFLMILRRAQDAAPPASAPP